MSITIGRINKDQGIKCDRSTPVGNPFPITSTRTREQALKEYDLAFKDLMQEPLFNAYFFMLVREAKKRDIKLLCWCHPKPCHCSIIKREIEFQLE